jgi:hypothetical protein
VTPAVVSGVAQTLSLFSNAKSYSSPQEDKGTGSPGADVPKDGVTAPVDTVNISSQSRQTLTDVRKEEAVFGGAKKEIVKKEDAASANGKFDMAASKVLFVYDQSGELSIRYMDTAERLIYQSPSELMKQMKEAASKSDSSVDTKA